MAAGLLVSFCAVAVGSASNSAVASCSAASLGQIVDAVRDGEVGLALPLTAEKGLSVILVLNQYK